MKEQYFNEKIQYFTENQTESDKVIRASQTDDSSFSQQHYVKFSEELYKTPRAYRRVIGYVKK